MRRLAILIAATLTLPGCGPSDPDRVEAGNYQSFWLWAGVRAPEGLKAKEWYLLDGEVRSGNPHYIALRPGTPHVADADVWLVIRTDTLDWRAEGAEALAKRADRWAAGGSHVVGIQIDFDARTRKLGDYAAFLARFRKHLPARYKLSVTGLMDWSAHGDPVALARLGGIVDEIVIQTYQGRATIPGYERYFDRMRGFPVPFKVGLVAGGRWIEPPALPKEAKFRGYVVFLINRR